MRVRLAEPLPKRVSLTPRSESGAEPFAHCRPLGELQAIRPRLKGWRPTLRPRGERYFTPLVARAKRRRPKGRSLILSSLDERPWIRNEDPAGFMADHGLGLDLVYLTDVMPL